MADRIDQLVEVYSLEEIVCAAEMLIERMKSAQENDCIGVTEKYLDIEKLEGKVTQIKELLNFERQIIDNVKASLMTNRKISIAIGLDSHTMAEIEDLISTIDSYKYGDIETINKIFRTHNELADKCLHEFRKRLKDKL